MTHYRDDTQFDKRRSELFLEQVNQFLSPEGELPLDSFVANAALAHYIAKYRRSTEDDPNPDADREKEQRGWVTAMYLGDRSLEQIRAALHVNNLTPSSRKRMTDEVAVETAGIIREIQPKGSKPITKLHTGPREREDLSLTPLGIKARVEQLYHHGYIESQQIALGIVLLGDETIMPTSLTPERVEGLKSIARTDIRYRIEQTGARTAHNEGIVTLKQLVGYELDGIAPQTIDQIVQNYAMRNGAEPELVREVVEGQVSSGLAHLYQAFMPVSRLFA